MTSYNKYPAGPYTPPQTVNHVGVAGWADLLAAFPGRLSSLLAGATEKDLLTKTAPGVWTVAQVVHHIADSHMNALIRMKLTLTEENPTIKPYDEAAWSGLEDGKFAGVRDSLAIIDGIHSRMARLLKSLDEKQIQRTFFHPEGQRTYTVGEVASVYAWHGEHHLGFIDGVLGPGR